MSFLALPKPLQKWYIIQIFSMITKKAAIWRLWWVAYKFIYAFTVAAMATPRSRIAATTIQRRGRMSTFWRPSMTPQ